MKTFMMYLPAFIFAMLGIISDFFKDNEMAALACYQLAYLATIYAHLVLKETKL